MNADTTARSRTSLLRPAMLLLLTLLILAATVAPASATAAPASANLTIGETQPEPDPPGGGPQDEPEPDDDTPEPTPDDPGHLVQPTPDPDPPGPQGAGDLKQPEGDDEEPTVTIDVNPVCEPQPGIAYEITVESPPAGALAYKAQWRESGGPVHTVDGQSGVIPTGEGEFEIRGVLHYQGPGFYPTEFVEVTVDCPTDGGEPGGGTPVDEPLPGIPNFTG